MTGEAGTGRQLQALLVEDDESVRTLVRYGLDATQIGLRVASGVREAWKLLEVEAFDAVILDLILPDGDGRRLLSELRAWPRTAKVPVVVLSAKGSRSIQLDCFRLGADEFFEKPFDPEVLGAVLIRQIQRAGTVVAEERLDSVTGLHSRASLATRFREVVAFANARSQAATLAYLELDGIEGSRERLGQSGVDLVLHEVARVLERTLRGSDVLGRAGSAAFVAMFPDTRSGPARQVVDRLSREVRSRGIVLPPSRESRLLNLEAGDAPRPDSGEGEMRVSFSASIGDARRWTDLDEGVRALEQQLRETDGQGPARIVSEEDASPRGAAKVRVLLVDDDPGVATLVRHRLEREGIEVHHVADGNEAMGVLTSEAELVDLDLVLLDVKLPGAGGYELLEALRARSSVRRVPVVMLTRMGREADVVRAFELGADDYVLKPFSPVELMARIRRLLHVA